MCGARAVRDGWFWTLWPTPWFAAWVPVRADGPYFCKQQNLETVVFFPRPFFFSPFLNATKLSLKLLGSRNGVPSIPRRHFSLLRAAQIYVMEPTFSQTLCPREDIGQHVEKRFGTSNRRSFSAQADLNTGIMSNCKQQRTG